MIAIQSGIDYRTVFDAASDGLVILARDDLSVLAANRAFRAMLRIAPDEGEGPTFFLTAAAEEVVRSGVRELDVADEFRCQTPATRSDGSSFDLELAGRLLSFDGDTAVLCVARDVTEQRRGEQQLESRVTERTREIESLLGVARAVASTLELDELVRLILEQLRTVVDYNAASLILVEDGELVIHDLLIEGPRGMEPQPSGIRFSLAALGGRVRDASGPSSLDYPCVQVAASPRFWEQMHAIEPVVIDDVLNSPGQLAADYRDTMGDYLHSAELAFMRTWIAVPLAVKGNVIGYIGMSSARPGQFTEKHARLAGAFADHAAIAIENARLYEHARQLAVLDERQRLARDLHDSVAQALYGIALGARTARKYLPDRPLDAVEPVDYAISLAAAGLAEMRALIFDLHPESLAQEGLIAAVNRQVQAIEARHGIVIERLSVEEPGVSLPVKEAAYAIVREALHNIVKHAQASTASVSLEVRSGQLLLVVSDDGVGFDPELPAPGHLGLRSMHERAARLGGSLLVESGPAGGTAISCSIPI